MKVGVSVISETLPGIGDFRVSGHSASRISYTVSLKDCKKREMQSHQEVSMPHDQAMVKVRKPQKALEQAWN